jgi:hypothetical protein
MTGVRLIAILCLFWQTVYSLGEIVLGPEDTLTIPLDMLFPGADAADLSFNHTGISAIGGVQKVGGRSADLADVEDVKRLVKLSDSLVGFITEKYSLVYLAVQEIKKKGSVQGVVKVAAIDDQQCYDAVHDATSNKVILICSDDHTSTVQPKIFVHFLKADTGVKLDSLEIRQPKDYHKGLGFKASLTRGAFLGTAQKLGLLIISGTGLSSPVLFLCSKISSSKIKDVSCVAEALSGLVGLSGISLSSAFSGVGYDKKGLVTFTCDQSTCENEQRLEGNWAALGPSIILTGTNDTIRYCPASNEKVKCGSPMKISLGGRYPHMIGTASGNTIVMTLLDDQEGKQKGWGYLQIQERVFREGPKNNIGFLFQDAIYSHQDGQGTLDQTAVIGESLQINAKDFEKGATTHILINNKGGNDHTSIDILPITVLSENIPKDPLPNFPTLSLTSPVVELPQDLFPTIVPILSSSRGERVDSKPYAIQGIEAADIIGVGRQTFVGVNNGNIGLYSCRYDDESFVLKCSQTVTGTSKVNPGSMKLVGSGKIAAGIYFVAYSDSTHASLALFAGGVITPLELKTPVLQAVGLTISDQTAAVNSLYPALAVRTSSGVDIYQYFPSNKTLEVWDSLPVEKPLHIESDENKIYVIEGGPTLSVDVYSFPDTDSPSASYPLPSNVTSIAGACLFKHHVLLAVNEKDGSPHFDLYPLSMLGLAGVSPLKMSIPEKMDAVTSIQCESTDHILARTNTGALVMSLSLLDQRERLRAYIPGRGRIDGLGRVTSVDSAKKVAYSWSETQNVRIVLDSKGPEVENITITAEDGRGGKVTRDLEIQWLNESANIEIKKKSHEYLKVGVHDVDNLLEFKGPIRNATIEGKDAAEVKLHPRLQIIKNYENGTLADRIYTFVKMHGIHTFAAVSLKTDGVYRLLVDIFEGEEYKGKVEPITGWEVDHFEAYSHSTGGITLYLSTADDLSTGSVVREFVYERLDIKPRITKLGFESGLLVSKLQLSIQPTPLLVVAAHKLLSIFDLPISGDRPRSFRVASPDFSLVRNDKNIIVVAAAGAGVEVTEFSGDNERREFIRQSKDLILWGTHCASEEKKGFICVFRSTSAYVVEMIFSWDTLRAAVQYHLVGEGYQIKAVRTGGSFVVGQVIGVDGKDKHEIHLWHSGKSGETGSITWAHPLDENGKGDLHSVPFDIRPVEGKVGFIMAIVNPNPGSAITFMRGDHLKIEVLKPEFNRQYTNLTLIGLTNKTFPLEYLTERGGEDPKPSHKSEVSWFVWTLMICLIVMSLAGIMLLLIYSINTHRAELYEKEQEGSYSRYEDSKEEQKATQKDNDDDKPDVEINKEEFGEDQDDDKAEA